MPLNKDVLLQINNLSTAYLVEGKFYNAVQNVSLTLRKNEILSIIGESGSGKSTLISSIVRLYEERNVRITGEILYNNKNLVTLSEEQMMKIRGSEIGVIFQNSISALNPLIRVGEQIEESLRYHTTLNKLERKKYVITLLKQVGIIEPLRVYKQYPHELSGGMRQRIMIAIAICCKPKVIIADEPTTALDVTMQAQILDLLLNLQRETEVGIILITHDLSVVAEMADQVAVMYAGEIVEVGKVKEIFHYPKHPYTKLLLQSIPHINKEYNRLYSIDGMVPSLMNMPKTGCKFSSRIPWIPEEAHEKNPTMHKISSTHFVRCTCWKHFYFYGGDFH